MNALIVIPQSQDTAPRSRWIDPKKAARRAWEVAAAGCGKVKKTVGRGRKAVADAKRSIDDRVSKAVGLEFEWCDAAVTVIGAGAAVRSRCGIGKAAASRVHDRGHWKVFAKVNKAIDRVVGRNHRLKWGHTIECLPKLIEECGWVAVPGYVVHLAQDFTTPAGIPLIPCARLAKIALQKCGLKATVATGLVTVNLAGVIGIVGTALILVEVGGVVYAVYTKVREKRAAKDAPILCLEGPPGCTQAA